MKAERKYLAHYIDVDPLEPDNSSGETDYIRIGKDLEEYTDDLQHDVSSEKNILGENNTVHKGFTPKSDTELLVRYSNGIPEKLAEKLMYIANTRKKDAATTKVDVLVNSSGQVIWAYRENVIIVPNTFGGKNFGIVVSYSIFADGSRELGSWDVTNKKFVPDNNRFIIIDDLIYAYLGKSNAPDIPIEHNGTGLKIIGSEVFMDRTDIVSITIPDGMEVIR